MSRQRVKIGRSEAPSGMRAGGFEAKGGEPPLNLLGRNAKQVDRRDVNLRWLTASILTGLTGAGLIGAAIHVSLQSEVSYAAIPERASIAPRPRASDGDVARKGDRLVRNLMIASAKQSYRSPVTVRLADREIIKVRPFVRVSSTLSMTTGVYATDIPRFDPMKIVADDSPERLVDPGAQAEAPGAEVTVIKRDLAEIPVEASAPALSDDDVIALVAEERRLTAEAGRRTALPLAPQILLSRTLQQGPSLSALSGERPAPGTGLFKSIDVLVVPENVTKLSKVELRPGEPPLVEEKDFALKRGESLESVLTGTGFAKEAAIQGIVAALGGKPKVSGLSEGQQFRVQIAPSPNAAEGRQVTRVVLYGESGVQAIAAMNDRGSFVSVAPPVDETKAPTAQAQTEPEDGEESEDDTGSGPRLYQSLYETAARHDLPRAAVDEMVRVFSYDIDFQRRIASGDALDVFYTYDEDSGSGAADRPELLYAALNIGGEWRKIYRFQSPDDGSVDYFDEQGRSLKKFLIRKPIADGIMRSGFGYRRHPILGYAKLHTGVDWANPVGTPIVAAGNGTVIKAEWDSGYGRRVEIQHINGYVTTYNHMSRFARGVTAGARVRQGQVIGYVGSTGLSTGAHLHYEVIINGHFVDPMKIRVPRGRELDGRLLAEFKRQRDQIEQTMQKSKSATAMAQRDAMR
ncbi:M23 family metallopeptidase [Methylobacterium organophilum]|uniref:M23 family metallopeptidase n=1 Tax=Methylobacterium organophilum TaxID=410 RepID=UPI001F13A33C|nr:M23 family metallopeptidase [Methylobacterium organophilum]UMY17919.1 M23 family metallopeptidase [Methylobacterium organophilum]